LWRAKRRPHDLNSLASEHVVKPIGKFLIPIANQKPHRLRTLCPGPGQLPRLLNDPWRVRIRRATGHCTRRSPKLDEEEDVEALQPDRLDREEIDSQQTLAVRAAAVGWQRRATRGRRRSSPDGRGAPKDREFVPQDDDFEFLNSLDRARKATNLSSQRSDT